MPNTGTRRKDRISYAQAFDINGNTPPQAVALEEGVLGALMLDQTALINAIETLHVDYFYKPEHQAVYRAIRKLFEQSQPVDLLTVVERLRQDGELEAAGGAYAVSKLTENVVSAAHIEYHIRVLSEKFIQREMIRISTETITQAYDETTDVVDLLDRTEQRLMDINDKNFRSDYHPMGDFVTIAMEQIKEAGEKSDGLSGLESGFVDLDRMTAGFQPGTLIILAARPAMGKTACALSMARNMAIDFHKPVAFFSLEMTGQELAMRLISSEARLPGDKLKRGHLAPYEQEQLKRGAQPLGSAPIYIDDTPQLTIFELRAKARRLKQRYDIQMIFIDYLQLMTSGTADNRNGNREQEISMISRQLKSLSKELGIPVLAMSQLSRAVENRVGNKPQLSDLRESGAIEQDADIVIFIYRPEYYGIQEDDHGSTAGMADLLVAKHRSGGTGEVRLRFVKEFARFENAPKFGDADAAALMPQNTAFDGGSMIVDSKMNDDNFPPDGDLDPF
ncbi:MAG: replicative DNA helicase [Bacteroidales bacterium]|nr:replicative DNA helicase [Bacteroidales bacterium]